MFNCGKGIEPATLTEGGETRKGTWTEAMNAHPAKGKKTKGKGASKSKGAKGKAETTS